MLRLPGWVEDLAGDSDRVYNNAEERMRFAVELSRTNVERGVGGPFGAAIFDRVSNRHVAPAVNIVVAANCSVAHAEIMAIMIAQQVVGSFDLEGETRPPYELVASTETCAMCLGAIPWSGARYLVCGARGEDAEGIGFNEGTKPSGWEAPLKTAASPSHGMYAAMRPRPFSGSMPRRAARFIDAC